MGLRSDSYYRGIAAGALQEAGIDEPPVPLLLLAERLGVPVRFVALPGFFSGAIINEDGLPVVLINGVRAEEHRMSALTHLLGHVLIVLAEPTESYPRNTISEHRQAEIVGEELILPEHLVRTEAAKWFNDYRYLARLFGVTESVMLERMRSLNIIRAAKGAWDY